MGESMKISEIPTKVLMRELVDRNLVSRLEFTGEGEYNIVIAGRVARDNIANLREMIAECVGVSGLQTRTPSPPPLPALSVRIKEMRRRLGVNQKKFSKMVGVGISTLSKAERGIMPKYASTECNITKGLDQVECLIEAQIQDNIDEISAGEAL